MQQLTQHLNQPPVADHPIKLFQQQDHSIYWLGISETTAFRSNTYLIQSGKQALLIDPGHRAYFNSVYQRLTDILPIEQLTGVVFCHQDPDVAASIVDWLESKADLQIVSSPRTNVLLPYYGVSEYDFYDIEDNPIYSFDTGQNIQFIESPFLHFAGAFTSYDCHSQMLFSGDIWAAIQLAWKLVVDDFENHRQFLDLFHIDYMASNIACRGYIEKIAALHISAILPQHGSIISEKDVPAAIDYLKTLNCGTDILYPHLSYDIKD